MTPPMLLPSPCKLCPIDAVWSIRRPTAFRLGPKVALLSLLLTVSCGDATPPDTTPGDAGNSPIDGGNPALDAPSDACVAQPVVSDERDIDMVLVMSSAA